MRQENATEQPSEQTRWNATERWDRWSMDDIPNTTDVLVTASTSMQN